MGLPPAGMWGHSGLLSLLFGWAWLVLYLFMPWGCGDDMTSVEFLPRFLASIRCFLLAWGEVGGCLSGQKGCVQCPHACPGDAVAGGRLPPCLFLLTRVHAAGSSARYDFFSSLMCLFCGSWPAAFSSLRSRLPPWNAWTVPGACTAGRCAGPRTSSVAVLVVVDQSGPSKAECAANDMTSRACSPTLVVSIPDTSSDSSINGDGWAGLIGRKRKARSP